MEQLVETFRFEWRWPEQLQYCEAGRTQIFHCAWSMTPPVVFLPSPDTWNTKMPGWLHDRRPGLVALIEQHSGHTTTTADWAY
jgi:hypothetical protein